ncbi:Ig-like domain-containing protein [Microbulbifer sp. OS29]|uniref:Ig-like domain-containing protein n=1 Tax=Microbulbifer okhotskensis TaxID=2926617 RepID=A0A9X2ENY6_9GAMM|nr:Ig-like domain-containing protein [Microbulbifer okhotskensis]MCO1334640.1 Ig-like domain-containing protein [Microbulbifer okhotskensis]
MDLADISLSGAMQGIGELFQIDEDTLELRPNEIWSEGQELTLLINAEDKVGNKMAEVSAKYRIQSVAPTVEKFYPEAIRLEKNESIKIEFSETMNPESLQLTGELLEDEYKIVWSTGNVENDTLSISPKEYWIAGQGRSVIVDVQDLAGNAVTTLDNSFTVPMYFENFASAAVVVGQDDFSSRAEGLSAKNLGAFPIASAAVSSDGKLFVSDQRNNRVLAFNAIPSVNGAPADFGIGVDSLDSTDSSDEQKTLQVPTQVTVDGNKFVISQAEGEGRILIYNSIPQNGDAVPSVILGTGNEDANECNSADSLITSILVDGKVISADEENSRALIWNSIPADSNAPADLVVGQPTLENCYFNGGVEGDEEVPSARVLAFPSAVWSDGQKLAILDSGNNRVLLWNQLPTENHVAADIVLGQEDFGDHDWGDTTTDKDFLFPWMGIWSNGIQLFVTDTENHRVLIWNQWPESNYAPADYVLGQSDFTKNIGNDTNQNGISDEGELPSAFTLNVPTGVFGYKNNLFVTDSANNRILIFKSH